MRLSTIKLDVDVSRDLGEADADWLCDEIETLREMLANAAQNWLDEHCAAKRNGITVESHY